MASFTVDLPAYGCLAPYSGTPDDALSTTDTATEIVISDVFQPIGVGTYGGTGYIPGINVVLPTLPAGATITAVHYVTIAYRESGNDITPDPGSTYTPIPINQPFLDIHSSARTARFTIDSLPIGGYAGEVITASADSYSYLQIDLPLNQLWFHYSTSSGPPVHVAYLAVRVTYTLPSAAPPCHLYPRDDNQGVGTAAIWPPPSSGGPASYY